MYTAAPGTAGSDLEEPRLRVIGLGASAGGLQPLSDFLRAFPHGAGYAFVVVQHLASAHKSNLAALLEEKSGRAVSDAADGLRIRPDQAYVITADTALTVAGGCLRVRAVAGHPWGLPSCCRATVQCRRRRRRPRRWATSRVPASTCWR